MVPCSRSGISHAAVLHPTRLISHPDAAEFCIFRAQSWKMYNLNWAGHGCKMAFRVPLQNQSSQFHLLFARCGRRRVGQIQNLVLNRCYKGKTLPLLFVQTGRSYLDASMSRLVLLADWSVYNHAKLPHFQALQVRFKNDSPYFRLALQLWMNCVTHFFPPKHSCA